MSMKIKAKTPTLDKIYWTITGNMRSLTNETASLITTDLRGRFKKEESPSGKKWPLLTPATIEDKFDEGFGDKPILVRTGKLRDSIGKRKVGIYKQIITSRGVVYARTHFHGDSTRGIPARPYIGLSKEAVRNIKNLFKKRIAQMLSTI